MVGLGERALVCARSRSTLPAAINTLSMIPYFVVAALDMSGYPDIARTIHYVLCAVDPPYIFLGGLYYGSAISTVADFLYGTRAPWAIPCAAN